MQEFSFDQRSPEWHAWRDGGIGASEIAAVMEESPWMYSQDLWETKKGIRPKVAINFAMQIGIDDEPLALSHYENMTGNIMVPLCASHDTYSFILSSFDGISPDRKLHVEIKCPGKKSHELALQGYVPRHYMWQIQQQLLVCGNDMGHFFSFMKDYPDKDKRGALVEVYADPEMQARIIAAGENFWQHIIDNQPMYTLDWEIAAKEWLIAQDDLDRAQAMLDVKREELIAISNGQTIKGAGVSIGKVVYKPTIRWDEYYADQVLTLPSLRKYEVVTFDSQTYLEDVKEQKRTLDKDVLKRFENPPKEPTIAVRKLKGAIDAEILRASSLKQGIAVAPIVVQPVIGSVEILESVYDF